ncbi:MAG: DUF3553 domain-containing protein, partial [Acidobacteria bacterium]|nr:DUF3553 domain-containing protein [Acidobacteriota bacterium]
FLTARGRAAGKPRASKPALQFRPPSSGRWKLGSQVRHPKFGLGTVLECEGEGEDAKLTVSFPGRGKVRLVERYASLEKA